MSRPPLAILADLIDADDRASAVAALPDDALLLVSGMLSLSYDENGDSGEILGICLVERSTRWGRIVMEKQRNAGGGE
jgi:hypothetical protein